MKKLLSKVYLILLAGMVAFQYLPFLLPPVLAEGQQRVSPSPNTSQTPGNPSKGPEKAVESKNAAADAAKKNPSPSPSESPKPAESPKPVESPKLPESPKSTPADLWQMLAGAGNFENAKKILPAGYVEIAQLTTGELGAVVIHRFTSPRDQWKSHLYNYSEDRNHSDPIYDIYQEEKNGPVWRITITVPKEAGPIRWAENGDLNYLLSITPPPNYKKIFYFIPNSTVYHYKSPGDTERAASGNFKYLDPNFTIEYNESDSRIFSIYIVLPKPTSNPK